MSLFPSFPCQRHRIELEHRIETLRSAERCLCEIRARAPLRQYYQDLDPIESNQNAFEDSPLPIAIDECEMGILESSSSLPLPPAPNPKRILRRRSSPSILQFMGGLLSRTGSMGSVDLKKGE